MTAAALLDEQADRPWVSAAPSIALCEPIGSTVDPAFGTDIEGLPCQVLDADLWFAESPTDLESAKRHCLDCPLRSGCLAGAIDRREPWGVWGGEIFEQGEIIARKRPRGRPRKNEAAA